MSNIKHMYMIFLNQYKKEKLNDVKSVLGPYKCTVISSKTAFTHMTGHHQTPAWLMTSESPHVLLTTRPDYDELWQTR